jgi:Tfp pilus assembly protein PilF
MKLAFFALASPTLSLAQLQSTHDPTNPVAGFVLLAVDGRPVEHARVDFLNPSTGSALAALTDAHGKFELAGLPPADYQVTVTAPSCEKLQANVSVNGSVEPLRLYLNGTEQPPAPTNDSVVSVQELHMSGKAESAFAKGTKLLQKGDAAQSIPYFQRTLAKDPNYYRAYHNLGLAYHQLGRVVDAEHAFQKAIDLTNGGYAPSLFAFAMVLCEEREFQQAERLIQNGLAMEPGSTLGKYFLGLVQFALDRPAEAEKSVRDALRSDASQPEAYILLAKIHERDHNPYAVAADVAAYRKLDPNGPLESEASKLLDSAQRELTPTPIADR